MENENSKIIERILKFFIWAFAQGLAVAAIIIIVLIIIAQFSCATFQDELKESYEEQVYSIPPDFVRLVERAADSQVPELIKHYQQLYKEQRAPTQEEYSDVMQTYQAVMMDYAVGYSLIRIDTGKGRMLKALARSFGVALFGVIFNEE